MFPLDAYFTQCPSPAASSSFRTQFNWTEYMSTFLPVDVTGDEPVVVYSVPYLQQIGQILQEPDRRSPRTSHLSVRRVVSCSNMAAVATGRHI